MNKLTILGVIGSILCLGFLGFGWYEANAIRVNNTIVPLEERFEAQKQNVSIVYDNMWKILKEQYGVTEAYSDKFGKIFPDIMAGRYQSGGSLFKMVQESNPNFDSTMYTNLQQSIEAQRNKALTAQQEEIDIAKEYNQFRRLRYFGTLGLENSFWMANKEPLTPKLITSTRTNTAVETGKDDETLFDKP